MIATRPAIKIGDGVRDIETWSPIVSDTDFEFEYIDIASIDREQKIIATTNRTRAPDAPSRARQIVQKGDVLVSTVRPGLNAVAIVPEPLDGAIASTGFTVLRCDDRRLHGPYLFHWVRSTSFVDEMVRLATGASYPAVSDRIVKNSSIPIPFPDDVRRSLAEQKRIATILNKADVIRRRRKQAASLTDMLIPSVFFEMFGHPVTNPKQWPKRALGALCEIRRGSSPRPIEAFLNGPVPWIKIGDGTKGDQFYIDSTEDTITEAGASKSVPVEPGALIVANSGVSLGFARIMKIAGCIHDGWLSLSELNDSLNKIFVLRLVNAYTDHLRRIAPSGTQPNLTTSIMKMLEIPVPPRSLQDEFEKVTLRIQRRVEAQKPQTEAMDDLFNSLVQRAFRGEL